MKTKEIVASRKVTIEGEVARLIRQHARSSPKSEICGVLIGTEEGNVTRIHAAIRGQNAAEAGTHVTFTQDTWEHIYAVKDEKYPDDRIVGWYHSHPGFGVFLSEHDTFIHENFFSSPGQIAWVYDPQSDEEGCFGWTKKEIVRVSNVSFEYLIPVGNIEDLTYEEDAKEVLSPRLGKEAASESSFSWGDLARHAAILVIAMAAGAITMLWYLQRETVFIPKDAFEMMATEHEIVKELMQRGILSASPNGLEVHGNAILLGPHAPDAGSTGPPQTDQNPRSPEKPNARQ